MSATTHATKGLHVCGGYASRLVYPTYRESREEWAVAADGWRVGPIIDPFGQGWQIGGPVGTWPPA